MLRLGVTLPYIILTYIILSGLYLGNRKVFEVDTW